MTFTDKLKKCLPPTRRYIVSSSSVDKNMRCPCGITNRMALKRSGEIETILEHQRDINVYLGSWICTSCEYFVQPKEADSNGRLMDKERNMEYMLCSNISL